MEKNRFLPHVTVAAIIEQNGQFLLVEEKVDGSRFFNQPAGHVEKNESLFNAIKREVLEETAFDFTPTFLTAIYQFYNPNNGHFYVRFCFGGILGNFNSNLKLDKEIIQTHFINYENLKNLNLRSPIVLKSIEDYLNGQRFDLNILKFYEK